MTRGAAYSTVTLARGGSATQLPLIPLIADNLSNSNFIGWPGSPVRQSVEGPGTIRIVRGTQPAAGAEMLEAVPTGARWRLLAIAIGLSTSATNAQRRVRVVTREPVFAAQSSYFSTPILQIQNKEVTYHILGTLSFATTGGNIVLGPLPNPILLAGHQVVSSTANLQADDQFGQPELYVEEWIEP